MTSWTPILRGVNLTARTLPHQIISTCSTLNNISFCSFGYQICLQPLQPRRVSRRVANIHVQVSIDEDARKIAQDVRGRSPPNINSLMKPEKLRKVTLLPKERWQIHKEAMKRKFGEQGWVPRKRLSPDAMDGVRELHKLDPQIYKTAALAEKFEVSPEAIRRILKSKWRPTDAEREDRRQRWEKRGETIWSQKATMGVRPPKKWRGQDASDTPRNSKKVWSRGFTLPHAIQSEGSNAPTVTKSTEIPISYRII